MTELVQKKKQKNVRQKPHPHEPWQGQIEKKHQLNRTCTKKSKRSSSKTATTWSLARKKAPIKLTADSQEK